MANTQAPFGFRPIQNRDSSPWCGKTHKVIILASDTNAYFSGDLVKFTGQQAVCPVDGKFYEVVTRAVASDTRLAGAITGVGTRENDATQFLSYRPAAAQTTNITAEIPMDRDVIYSAQFSGAPANNNFSQANVDFVVGNGDTVTGNSEYTVDSSTIATTDTLPLRLMGYEDSLLTESGEFAIVKVTLNQDAYSDKTGL